MSIPSFCIPHLMSFVTEAKVKRVFNELFECECVKEIQMVPMEKDGKCTKCVSFTSTTCPWT